MEGTERKKVNGELASSWIRYKRNKLALVGLFMLIFLVLIVVFADVIADYDTDVIGQNIMERLKPPSSEHWFGTDQYGRDLFARVIHGTRISLLIGIITVLFSLFTGVLLGAIAGFFGGWIDNVIMRIMDVLLALPQTLLAVAIVAALGTEMRNIVLALSIGYTPWFARIIRSTVFTVKGQDFVEAARCYGTSNARIIVKHILPNSIGPIIVQATLQVGMAIIAVAGLSFIGLGIQPPIPEWGTMLAEGKEVMRYHPNMVIMPGLAILVTVTAINLIGDGLRDALDPKMKR